MIPDRILELAQQLERYTPEQLLRIQVASVLTLLHALEQREEPAGFDTRYFHDLLQTQLGVSIDDETLQKLLEAARSPQRLERGIATVRKRMEQVEVQKPVGLLFRVLASWNEKDRA